MKALGFLRTFSGVFSALLFLPLIDAQEGQESLKTLKFQFQVQRAELSSAQQKFNERYAEELEKLEKSASDQGKLELVLEVRREAEEYEGRTRLEKSSAHPALARLQKIHTDQTKSIATEAQKKLRVMVSKYIEKLDDLKTELTKARRIDEAVAVQAEIERVGQLAEDPGAEPSISKEGDPDGSKSEGDVELIGHWTFDEDGRDSSAHRHDAQLFGAEIVDGHIGAGALKTGDGMYALVPPDPFFNLHHPFTLSLWAYKEPDVVQSSYAFLFVKYGKVWGINLDQAGETLVFQIGVRQARDPSITLDQGSLKDGKWQHIAAVFDGKSSYLFVDGRERGSNEGNVDLTPVTSGGNLHFGGVENGTRNFTGMLDDLRVYRGVLTKSQIRELSEGGNDDNAD